MTMYEQIPNPGIVTGDIYKHDEILYSEHYPHVPKGLPIGPNQVLLGGQVVARKDSDKRYYPYDADGDDGLDVARGVNWWSTSTGANGGMGNILLAGLLKLEKVHGYDEAALTQLGAVIDDVQGTFKF